MFKDEMMTNYFNLRPSDVKSRNNITTDYYRRYLYSKIYSVFEFTLPKDWQMNYFRYWLFHFGSIATIYTNEFGWICHPYSVEKLDIYKNPKSIIITDENFNKDKGGIIGVNAAIIRLMDDYFGLDDIVTRYAEMLAQCDRSINVNLMNANISLLFEAENKKQADTMKEAYGKATSGEPLIVLNKDVADGKQLTTLMNSPKNNYIASDILTTKRTLVNEFLTEIGIKNANYDKKERLNSQEVSENNDETSAIVTVMYENLKSTMEVANNVSDGTLALDVKMHYDYSQEGGAENADDIGRAE